MTHTWDRITIPENITALHRRYEIKQKTKMRMLLKKRN